MIPILFIMAQILLKTKFNKYDLFAQNLFQFIIRLREKISLKDINS